MRIISGRYKGRVIKMPKGIRPTQDKVRKALFDILGNIEGLSFLELFSGTGAVGLEAISMGVRDLTLVEQDSECLAAIKKNISFLQAANCSLLPKEADSAVKALYKGKKQFDIIFLDPPYYKEKATPGHIGLAGVPPSAAKKTLQTLAAYDILAPDGLIVVQHFKKDDLPDNLGVFALFRQSRYGDTVLSFYRKV